MKPRLVDFSQFQDSSITPKLILNDIKISMNPIKSTPIKGTFKEIPKVSKVSNDNIIKILFNLVFIIIILIGIYLLYIRYKKKDENKIKYNKKIENLYNTINKY